jgi:site-specific DNA recombinase
MIDAAIYARKSKKQEGVAEESKSVTLQVESGTAFAAARGWRVLPEHIYVDDGISGAEFENRPSLVRLMSALNPKSPFSFLIVSEQKSIGREQYETNYVIKRLSQAGVEIFEYMHGRSLTPKTAMDKAVSSLQSFADEDHTAKTRERMHVAHAKKARMGYVVGGRVFGYKNQDVFSGLDQHGRPLRSHVERVINPVEAAVVRRIFELYDTGYGLKRIAKILNSEGAPSPVHPTRGDGLASMSGWSPSTVGCLLKRELYRGVVVWNKTTKKDSWGARNTSARPAEEWVRAVVEELRIIDESRWLRVESRRKDVEGKAVRFEGGRLSGRPPKGTTINLLPGLATCGVCGGGLIVEHSNNRKGHYSYYICHRQRNYGTCENHLRVQVAEMNEAVLVAIEEHALTPEAIEQVIQLSERDDVAEQQATLAKERQDVEKRIARLIAAIETGGDAASLVAKVRELEARVVGIDSELRSLRPIPRLAPAVINNRLSEWRRLLRQSTTQARTVLQRVVNGRITFTPTADGRGYTFEAATRFDKLFTGIVAPRPGWAPEGDVRGTEHIRPGDTPDEDYGQLLDRITQKGVCARRGSNPRPAASKADALSN